MRVVEIRRSANGFSNYNETVVVVEEPVGGPANPIETLLSAETKQFALAKAAQEGMANPALSINLAHPYPVDAEGKPITKVGPDAPKVVAYRVDIPVVSRI